LVKICLLFVSFWAVFSETFTGNPAIDIPTQQALSYQYSSIYLEFQSLMAWSSSIVGWRTLVQMDAATGKLQTASYLEEDNGADFEADIDNDDDFNLEEEKPKNLEMFGAMGMGMGGYGYGGYGYPQSQPQQPANDKKARRRIEASTEYSIMYYLKYLNIITARKLEVAQNTHYQSRAVTSALQGLGATNPMASSLLYMLYYRDVIQTLMLSQSIQRHDIWSVWNFLEIMETNEDPDHSENGHSLRGAIKNAYAISMRVFATEAMFDFQTLMIDFYLQPMLAQVAGGASPYAYPPPTNGTSYLEVESTAQPEKPFFGAMGGNPQMMMTYYVYMFKFYAKYLLLNAAQSLAMESSYTLGPHQVNSKDAEVQKSIIRMKQTGLATLHQWVQIKTYLVYFDMYMMMSAPGFPQLSVDGPAAHLAASNLVQTDDKAAPRVENPVVENQAPVAAVPQQIPQQPAHQSVVG